jgi:hypothetical protein
MKERTRHKVFFSQFVAYLEPHKWVYARTLQKTAPNHN